MFLYTHNALLPEIHREILSNLSWYNLNFLFFSLLTNLLQKRIYEKMISKNVKTVTFTIVSFLLWGWKQQRKYEKIRMRKKKHVQNICTKPYIRCSNNNYTNQKLSIFWWWSHSCQIRFQYTQTTKNKKVQVKNVLHLLLLCAFDFSFFLFFWAQISKKGYIKILEKISRNNITRDFCWYVMILKYPK